MNAAGGAGGGRGKGPAKGTGKTSGRGAASGANRQLTTRVKSARGRKLSSKLWLERQLNDPYVEAAQREGLRSRAAYKLMQIDERHRLLKPGMRIVDLGAAPGGWSVVAAARVAAAGTGADGEAGAGRVIALDISPMEPIPGVTILTMDFMADGAERALLDALGGERADGVLTDMAAPATGHRATDHLRIMALCEVALAFALQILAPGGFFLAKVLQGGTEGELLATMKRHFRTVRHVKPPSSRADSAELYVLATGFRGPALEGSGETAA
ncbi:MAG: 23S rRNA methyltransferase [Rhizobiales bacterium]|nr:23S rRNA methyltransferase [Hyphomicrobiales bacterium]